MVQILRWQCRFCGTCKLRSQCEHRTPDVERSSIRDSLVLKQIFLFQFLDFLESFSLPFEAICLYILSSLVKNIQSQIKLLKRYEALNVCACRRTPHYVDIHVDVQLEIHCTYGYKVHAGLCVE